MTLWYARNHSRATATSLSNATFNFNPTSSPATHPVQLVAPTSSGAPVIPHPPLTVRASRICSHFLLQAPFSQDGFPIHLAGSICAKLQVSALLNKANLSLWGDEEPLRSATRNSWGPWDLHGNLQNLDVLGYSGGCSYRAVGYKIVVNVVKFDERRYYFKL